MLQHLPIETGELVIDKFTPSDAEALYAFMNLPEIKEFIPDRLSDLDEAREILDWLIGNYDKESSETVRITLPIRHRDGDLVGWVSYGPLPYDETLKELAYAIAPKYWNRGYATLAGRAFLDWLRANITSETIFGEVDAANWKSIKVVEKLNFAKIKQDEVRRDDSAKTVCIYKWNG